MIHILNVTIKPSDSGKRIEWGQRAESESPPDEFLRLAFVICFSAPRSSSVSPYFLEPLNAISNLVGDSISARNHRRLLTGAQWNSTETGAFSILSIWILSSFIRHR